MDQLEEELMDFSPPGSPRLGGLFSILDSTEFKAEHNGSFLTSPVGQREALESFSPGMLRSPADVDSELLNCFMLASGEDHAESMFMNPFASPVLQSGNDSLSNDNLSLSLLNEAEGEVSIAKNVELGANVSKKLLSQDPVSKLVENVHVACIPNQQRASMHQQIPILEPPVISQDLHNSAEKSSARIQRIPMDISNPLNFPHTAVSRQMPVSIPISRATQDRQRLFQASSTTCSPVATSIIIQDGHSTSCTPPSVLALEVPVSSSYDYTQSNSQNLKRLARKAELARESRKKRKQYIEELEVTVLNLEAKIADLESRHSRTCERRKTRQHVYRDSESKTRQAALLSQLVEMLKLSNGTSSSKDRQELVEKLSEFSELYREFHTKVDYHLDRIEESIDPSLQIKFALWGLDQADDFYDNPGLWTSLMRDELGIAEDVLEKIKSYRGKMHEHRRDLLKAEDCLRILRDNCALFQENLNIEVEKFCQILSPEQLVKFYCWIEQNEWSMQMLSFSDENRDKKDGQNCIDTPPVKSEND